ncbi:CMP-sialic acid transporter 2 [Capsicum baccatum]|uniref:CMP-sialic acid transporter 2 n=1 Tax=Capsicum baccatum TaxID=33114 RepID=A0A2G2VY36_CAPBA|nr:CMP-sialic acid transporter 2 [Capsicum baccatum]
MKNGMAECAVCHSKLVSLTVKTISKAYDRHRSKISLKQCALNVLLVVGDCMLIGLLMSPHISCQLHLSAKHLNLLLKNEKDLSDQAFYFPFQPVLVFMSKVDGKFKFNPAARNNVLLAVPALLDAINNYLKFIMQVLVIAVLLKLIMNWRFSLIQWEALALLLIGISINQLRSLPEGATSLALPVTTIAYIYTLIFVTVPSLPSVFNEYALKSQYDTSIYL